MNTIEEGIKIVARIAYLDGQIKGIRDYAIWKNGEQLVGCLQRPLKEVIGPLEEEMQALKEKVEANNEADSIIRCGIGGPQ